MDEVRKAFETHVRSRNPDACLDTGAGGDYVLPGLEKEWLGWKAGSAWQGKAKKGYVSGIDVFSLLALLALFINPVLSGVFAFFAFGLYLLASE